MRPSRFWGLMLLSFGALTHATVQVTEKITKEIIYGEQEEAQQANQAKEAAASSSESSSKSSDASSSGASDESSSSTSGVVVLTGTHTSSSEAPPTSTSVSTTLTLGSTESMGSDLPTATDNGTSTEPVVSTGTVTYLTGSITLTTTGTVTFTGNFSTTSATSTSSAPTVTNTQPCNGYVELCERKYSNITQVGCHNSPFVKKGNAAANQALDVTQQLNDGVRVLQGQMHWNNNDTEPHFCHTTCDILDAGPISDWLGKVKDWVASNRFEVVTLILENGNYSNPSMYVPYINQTGILDYVYTPPFAPMNISQWPTLAEMIIYNTRVVMFLDYQANQTAYPWWIDEFSNMWETPFDPTDRAFPCTISRPDGLSVDDGRRRLYLTNHNLNVEVSLLGTSLLIPDTSMLNTTNNVTGYGSLGQTAINCTADYGRPPNVLNVDYYNYGGPYDSGAVFQVAAKWNNVTYQGGCCGKDDSSGAGALGLEGSRGFAVSLAALALSIVLVW